MKNLVLIFVLMLGIISSLSAQHCPWDGSTLVIVDVIDESTGETIDGLLVVLADSNGVPYVDKRNYSLHLMQETSFTLPTDTLRFGQNPREFIATERRGLYPYHIPFGLGCYMLRMDISTVASLSQNESDFLLIFDPSGVYEAQKIPFSKEFTTSLCTNNPIWHDESALDEVKIKVKLKRKL